MTARAVFDCMVYLQAVTNEAGPAFACFGLVEQGRVALCVSAELLAEVEEVLARPKLRAKFPSLTPDRVSDFLERVKAKAVTVDEVPRVFAYPRDPDDEPSINLALVAQARYLVSRDKDLLDLMNDADFRRRFPGLIALDPVAFLRELRTQQDPPNTPQG